MRLFAAVVVVTVGPIFRDCTAGKLLVFAVVLFVAAVIFMCCCCCFYLLLLLLLFVIAAFFCCYLLLRSLYIVVFFCEIYFTIQDITNTGVVGLYNVPVAVFLDYAAFIPRSDPIYNVSLAFTTVLSIP